MKYNSCVYLTTSRTELSIVTVLGLVATESCRASMYTLSQKNSGPLFNEASALACTGATEPALRNGRRSQRARAGRALGLAKYARADALAELVTKAR